MRNLAPILLVSMSANAVHGLHLRTAQRPVSQNLLSRLEASSVAEETAVAEPEKPSPKTYLDDGFVFGLEGSGLDRPTGKTAQIVVDGDSLETKPWQVAVVAGTFLGHGLFIANGTIERMLDSRERWILLFAVIVSNRFVA